MDIRQVLKVIRVLNFEEERKTTVSDKEIRELEEYIGVNLPPSFIIYLKECDIDNYNVPCNVDRVYERIGELEEFLPHVMSENKNIIPFGGDGDYYCFDTSKSGDNGEYPILLVCNEDGSDIDFHDNFTDLLMESNMGVDYIKIDITDLKKVNDLFMVMVEFPKVFINLKNFGTGNKYDKEKYYQTEFNGYTSGLRFFRLIVKDKAMHENVIAYIAAAFEIKDDKMYYYSGEYPLYFWAVLALIETNSLYVSKLKKYFKDIAIKNEELRVYVNNKVNEIS